MQPSGIIFTGQQSRRAIANHRVYGKAGQPLTAWANLHRLPGYMKHVTFTLSI